MAFVLPTYLCCSYSLFAPLHIQCQLACRSCIAAAASCVSLPAVCHLLIFVLPSLLISPLLLGARHLGGAYNLSCVAAAASCLLNFCLFLLLFIDFLLLCLVLPSNLRCSH
jgi:hypothetical protein